MHSCLDPIHDAFFIFDRESEKKRENKQREWQEEEGGEGEASSSRARSPMWGYISGIMTTD